MATTEHQKPYVTEQHKPLTYYGAYPYAYNNLKSIDEKVFHDELMDFKHTGHATTKIVNAYANLVSKAVLDNGTFKDSLVVYTPSKDIGGSNQRFHMVKEKLDKFHLHQEPDAIVNTINKKSSVDPVTHKKDNHNILDGLVFDTEKIKGKKIILIDDILTKGEHARTITDELYKHGAADVKLVTLCITPPSQGHEDTRYRFGLTEAEQSKNLLKFNQEMKPDIYQKQLYNLDLKEREIPMNLVFDNENKAEKAKITPIDNLLKDAYPKRLQEDNLNLAAETKSNVYVDNKMVREPQSIDYNPSDITVGALWDKFSKSEQEWNQYDPNTSPEGYNSGDLLDYDNITIKNIDLSNSEIQAIEKLVSLISVTKEEPYVSQYASVDYDKKEKTLYLSGTMQHESWGFTLLGCDSKDKIERDYGISANTVLVEKSVIKDKTLADNLERFQREASMLSDDIDDLKESKHADAEQVLSYKEEMKRQIDQITNESKKLDSKSNDTDTLVYLKGIDNLKKSLEVYDNHLTNISKELSADIHVTKNDNSMNDDKSYSNIDNKNNTNNSLNKSSNMAEEQKDQEKKQNTGVSTSFIGYANVAQQKDAQGNLKKVAEPTFTGRIKMEKLLNAPTTQYTDKNGKTGEWIKLAVVVSPKAKESANNSSHMLITSRQGKEVEVNGKQVKFADVQSQYEIKIDKQSLLKAAKAAGIADDGSIDLKFGKKEGGVQLNPSQYPMITDKKNLEIFSNIHTTNSFENYKTSQQNLGKVGPNRYDDNYLGQSFGFQVKDKDGNLKVNANNDPVMMHNIKLDANKIKFLQECDHFGNVNLAIVKRDLSPEKLGEKGLKMVDGSNFPVNQYGIKQPNFFVIADPKVYKNGEPNANVVAVIKINKQELAALPHTTEDFKTKDGKQVHNEYIHISMDQFKNIKPNVKDYQFKGVEVKDSSNLTANVTSYNPQIAQQERKAWEDSHPRLNEAEFKAKLAAEKDMPNQYQAYSSAVKIMFASKLQNNPSQAQAQTQQQAQDDNQTKQKNSPKW